MGKPKRTALTAAELALFCSQMSWLLKAAVPLEEGLSAVCENTRDTGKKRLIQNVLSGLEKGTPLSASLKSSGAFPEYLASMAEIGEKAGKLDDVFSALARHYEREDELKSRIRGAVTYPTVLILMIAAVIALLDVKVLPVFRQVLEDLGSGVPAASIAAVQVGLAAGRVALALILAWAALAAAGVLAAKTRKGAAFLRGLADRLPPARRIFAGIDTARFSSALAMLLSSGYGAAQALELLPGILSSPQNGRRAREIARRVSQGVPFSQALRKSGLFPGIYSSLIGVGEKAGNLDAVMDRIAARSGEEAQEKLSGAVSAVEPVLIGVLSAVIGVILLSILLPLMGILSGTD